MSRPAVLVVAGSDSSGGAGIACDVRTLDDFGADALCVITAVTAQSNRRVSSIHHVPPAVIRAQIEAAFQTREPCAVKLGMLGCRATVEAVAAGLRAHETLPWVLDPVLASSSGGVLLDSEGRVALLARLLPHAALVTPNAPEAAVLLGEDPAADDDRATDAYQATDEATLRAQAQRILALGPRAVLLKGGHGRGEEAVDWLVSRDRPPERIASARVPAARRGTGCALASAIAAQLGAGRPLDESCRRAKAYVVDLLRAASAR
jgi:hydroxymethylpyrimidine/phosphomethylpyrimidine kinase